MENIMSISNKTAFLNVNRYAPKSLFLPLLAGLQTCNDRYNMSV